VTIGLDYTFLIQIINFLALIFILNLLLYKPILAIIGRRKKQLDDSESEIGRLNETVEQKMAAYEEKLRQAKASAVEQKNEIVRQGAEEAKTVIDAAREEIPGIMDEFHARMDGEIGAAKAILADRSRQLSVQIAEKILGRSLQ